MFLFVPLPIATLSHVVLPFHFRHTPDMRTKRILRSHTSRPMGSSATSSSSSSSSYVPPVTSRQAYNGQAAGTSSIAPYNPYAPPRRAQPGPAVTNGSSAPRASKPVLTSHESFLLIALHISAIRFKPSPFFGNPPQVSGIQECPGESSTVIRR